MQNQSNRKQSYSQNQNPKRNRWNAGNSNSGLSDRDPSFTNWDPSGRAYSSQTENQRARQDADAAFSGSRDYSEHESYERDQHTPKSYFGSNPDGTGYQRGNAESAGRNDYENTQYGSEARYGRDANDGRDANSNREWNSSRNSAYGRYDSSQRDQNADRDTYPREPSFGNYRTGLSSGPSNSIGSGTNYGSERSFGQSRGLGSNSYGSDATEQYGLHYGKGPKNYKRSDARIQEDVHEALTHDHHVDASEIEVSVKDGIVTLSGNVSERKMKRFAEECVENVTGVQDVKNEITTPSLFGSKTESKTGGTTKGKSAANHTDMM